MNGSATTQSIETLVKRVFVRDKADSLFRSAVKKSHRALKKAPGGVRSWLFYQTEHGAINPQRAIFEMIDHDIDANAPKTDVDLIAQVFADYIDQRYAEREATKQAPTVGEALRLECHADADADKAQADAALNPTLGNLERVVEATARHEATEETLLTVCRRELRMS